MSIPEPLPSRTSSVAQPDAPASPPVKKAAGSSAAPPLPVGWRWRRPALLLSVAAQLIIIAALESADPLKVSWAALLLAIAPAPLAAVVQFASAPVARLAVVVAVCVLVAGIAGEITHTGVFFVPALAALVGAAVRLWAPGDDLRAAGHAKRDHQVAKA
jgi:hypothetical protein